MFDSAALIDALGGPTQVARLLGYDKQRGGPQRVQNWKTRGVPYKVQIQHAPLWMSAQRVLADQANNVLINSPADDSSKRSAARNSPKVPERP